MKIFKILRPSHLVSNFFVYSIGTAIAIKGGLSIINLNYILGAISFLLLYGSIYAINDIHDIEEDRNHEIKWKRERPLVKGEIDITHAKIAVSIFIIISIIIGLQINTNFIFLLVLLFFSNVIYTFILKGRNIPLSLLFVGMIQSIKILLGIVSINGTKYPIYFMLMYSLGYSFVMGIYKKSKLKKHFKGFEIITGISALVFFLLSFSYNYLRSTLGLLIILGVVGSFIIIKIKNRLDEFFTKGIAITSLFNFILLILILIT